VGIGELLGCFWTLSLPTVDLDPVEVLPVESGAERPARGER
jgi:hypothetical protein